MVEAADLIESVVVSIIMCVWHRRGALTLASQIDGDGGTWQYCEGGATQGGQYG